MALYKKTHKEQYNEKYIRRLMLLGSSEEQAHNLFLFELMILKHDSIDALADERYIYSPLIDTSHVLFPEEDRWYVDHQMFLLSEMVKIWDEAEYIWVNRKDRVKDLPVRERIYSLTRYGGGELFREYLSMISEKAHTGMELLQAYAVAEQDLIYIYRWKREGIDHPYDPDRMRNKLIRIGTAGDDKVRAIKLLREISFEKLSLKEAVDIVDGCLPYTVPYAWDKKKAEYFLQELEKIGASAQVLDAKNRPRQAKPEIPADIIVIAVSAYGYVATQTILLIYKGG